MLSSGLIPIMETASNHEFIIDKTWAITLYSIISLPFQIMATYLIAYLIIPKYVFTKNYFLGVLSLLISTYIISFLLRTTMVHGIEPLIRTPPVLKESLEEIATDLPHLFFKYTLRIYQPVLFFLFIKYFIEYREQKERVLLLDRTKAESELKMLKMQLNPHFLFNTLNNIYTLAILKSEEAPQAIIKLSHMLDYIIYDGALKTVPIEKEIDVINNFIELQRLRYSDLDLTFEENISEKFEVAPMILLSLVENAFKHCGKNKRGQLQIHISIHTTLEHLVFKIWNTKKQEYTVSTNKNIGNKNLIKQLELSYANNYTLQIENIESTYCVILKITK